MIVDAHTHFWFKGFMPAAFHRGTAEEWAKKEAGRTPEMILPKIEEGVTDPDGKDYVANMDKAGVDASIIMMTDFGTYWTGEEPAVPYEEQVVRYGEFQKQSAGRLFVCAYVDPRRKECAQVMKKAVKECGLKGCGEFTTKGVLVSSDEAKPLVKACADLDIPVVIHTRAGEGTNLAGADFTLPNHNHPGHIAKLLKDYKDLKVVIAHAGYPKWWEAAIQVAKGHPSCYLELSNWNFGGVTMEDFVPILACMRDTIGADHMLFASDHPSGKRYRALGFLPGWVDYFKGLPEKAKTLGYEFTDAEVNLILGENAKRLFKL
jgi:predicted TIM-barrel fold metal-dependent hydrolase